MPTRLRPVLLCCATLSLAAHAVLLDALALAPHVRREVGGAALEGLVTGSVHTQQRRAPSAQAMQFRTVHATELSDDEATRPAQAVHEPEVAPIADPVQAHADLADEAVAAHASPPDIAEPDESAFTATAPSPEPLPGHNTEAYIPRPQLSVAPVAQTPVLLTAPEGQRKATRRVGVLALFIDEAGRVHHIEPDEPRLPPDFERVARDAFMHTVFTPGQLDGRIVKSRIRVEVVFDNTPLDDAVPQGNL